MNERKGLSVPAKIFIGIAALILIAAGANIICTMFSTRMKKYYRVDNGLN